MHQKCNFTNDSFETNLNLAVPRAVFMSIFTNQLLSDGFTITGMALLYCTCALPW